jgi:hypothetical protein
MPWQLFIFDKDLTLKHSWLKIGSVLTHTVGSGGYYEEDIFTRSYFLSVVFVC